MTTAQYRASMVNRRTVTPGRFDYVRTRNNTATIQERQAHLTPDFTMVRDTGRNIMAVKLPMPLWPGRLQEKESEYQANYKDTVPTMKAATASALIRSRNGGRFFNPHPTRSQYKPKDHGTDLFLQNPLFLNERTRLKSTYMANYTRENNNPVGMDNPQILGKAMGWTHHQQAK